MDSKDQATQTGDGYPKQHGTHPQLTIEGQGQISDNESTGGFRFGRMFPTTSQHPVVLSTATFKTLGAHMTAVSPADRGDSDIPAGYTYFGQFVDHDITMDTTGDADTPGNQTPLTDLIQSRSPSLDLDSLYGHHESTDDNLFEPGSAKFRIGTTTSADGRTQVKNAIPYDLPRKPAESDRTKTALKANIGDPRNDENLVVAQIHLAWLKFHNHVVDRLTDRNPRRNPMMLRMEAREIVTHHYQHIVLNDFVKRFIDPAIFEDVIVGGNRKHLRFCCGEIPFMPLEFSVAAFRYGHTQVREEYDWNVNFNPRPGARADSRFSRLFEFSEVSGNFGGRGATLPTNWVADFRRLFNFEKRKFPQLSGSETGDLNMAKKIDPFLAGALGDLPELRHLVPKILPTSNLAALNLRKGSMRRLPSGQDVSRELTGVKVLSETEMRSVLDADFAKSVEDLEMFERTPLWLYILLEAAAKGDGNKLGPLGSTIVAETFLTLILTSRTSIIQGTSTWTPDLDQEILNADEPLASMPAVLAWMDKLEAIIDPLQDQRVIASQQLT